MRWPWIAQTEWQEVIEDMGPKEAPNRLATAWSLGRIGWSPRTTERTCVGGAGAEENSPGEKLGDAKKTQRRCGSEETLWLEALEEMRLLKAASGRVRSLRTSAHTSTPTLRSKRRSKNG